MATKNLPGRPLALVRYPSTCPQCGCATQKGDVGAWYVTKHDSRSGKGEVFCNRKHAELHYGTTTQPVVQPPVAPIPEPDCGAVDSGYTCSLAKGHTVPNHEAHTSAGEIVHVWPVNPAAVVEPEVIPEPEPVGVIVLDGVEISTVGKHRQFPLTLRCAHAGVNVLLVGPAGSGKSTLAKQVHQALVEIRGGKGTGWCSISLAADTPSSKLFGYCDAGGTFRPTPFYGVYTGDGAEAGTILIDELDNGGASVVAGLNQALANGEAAFANGNSDRHEHSRVLAASNTFGKGGDRLYVSRQQLDAASLDRFTTIEVDYDEELETQLAYEAGSGAALAAIGDLLSTVRHARRRAADKKLPLVFGPRASIDGAKLLAAGVTLDEVLDIRVFAGVSSDVRAGLQ